ncbi:hypothetical protein FBUS_01536 [Fasciolopsis buskii]|uniref:Uncharacterized protein n=1 Tax=Fasciolopsis buskii TaxID=27845 RepID=A0A8E0RTR6_9TREM|nr:hypothetical protein FBUS_01536 [Fasciolopsis buski]
MNPASPIVNEAYTGYDDTKICSPFLTESQPNVALSTNGSAKTNSAESVNILDEEISASETLNIPFIPNLLPSFRARPRSESVLTDRTSAISVEELIVGRQTREVQSNTPYLVVNSSSSSDDTCSLDEPISSAAVDFPIPETLSTLERNIAQPQVDQSRLSAAFYNSSDMPPELNRDYKHVIKGVESCTIETDEDCFKTIRIISPLIENARTARTVQTPIGNDLIKHRELMVLGFAPLQEVSQSLTAKETSSIANCSTMAVKQGNQMTHLSARSQSSPSSVPEGNAKTRKCIDSTMSMTTEASKIRKTSTIVSHPGIENYVDSDIWAPIRTNVFPTKSIQQQPNPSEDYQGIRVFQPTHPPPPPHHLQPPDLHFANLRPRIISQSMTSSWSPTSLKRDVNWLAPRSASTSPLVAKKVYLNHITGGALWSFDGVYTGLPHSSTHSGLAFETDTRSDDDKYFWCVGSGESSDKKIACDYENMENWPWPPKKQDVAKVQSTFFVIQLGGSLWACLRVRSSTNTDEHKDGGI